MQPVRVVCRLLPAKREREREKDKEANLLPGSIVQHAIDNDCLIGLQLVRNVLKGVLVRRKGIGAGVIMQYLCSIWQAHFTQD